MGIDLINGITAMLTPFHMVLILVGVAMGLVFGSIPGLTATMAVAICLPITFTMEPQAGMALLMGLYIGGVSGGLIPAILLKIPGTPSSIATTFDGYPMAQNGQAGKALGYGVVYSFLGGLFSIIVLILIAPPLAKVALKFGPMEYFAITIFALTLIASLSEGSLSKGMLGALLGIALAMVGAAPIDAYPRFTFGLSQLNAGFNLLPALIGLFAISEILQTAEKKINPLSKGISVEKVEKVGYFLKQFPKSFKNWFRSSIIGTAIGILPGIGGGTANIVAYATAKNQSKDPETYGKGNPEGLIASESANNAAIGGALVPLMALGIPGDTVTAMLLGGLIIHGIQPGPLFFTQNTDVVYGIFAALIIANIAMVIFMLFGMKFFIKILSVPRHILLPIIIVLCGVGAFTENNRVFDMWVLLFFGLMGYVLIKLKFPITPILLGFILGPIAEINLRRGLMATQGDFMPFITSPIPLVIWILVIVSILFNILKNKKQKKQNVKGDVINAS
ncbi:MULTISPECIES: tripartite tricarboxylate transporter permease [unclassified Sporosarcina]|uniref:tripartite tricarboxylate transporter permease n=1 Tax=unclassified Sporosarcina TaxID=2647733 RepID=UPI0020404D71|nr:MULTISPECIES: tripartite tricarboxylate transporter permease [unclassified Sporosarcina]GKV65917.1 C4-dicarboxylate ABC transporter permease [Sporosarcina sp. NCCP-2331]GLB56083.1 C4-dicarboxylate ABC transporter permease [Sporosarcina sp. NCCP-2378]